MISSRTTAPIVALTIAATRPTPGVNAEPRQQPFADERADDADDDVADDAESVAAHNLTGEPSGDETNKQNDEKTFVGKMHAVSLGVSCAPGMTHGEAKSSTRVSARKISGHGCGKTATSYRCSLTPS